MHQQPILIQSLIIVEDEPLIAMMIEEFAADLGWFVDGSAHTEASGFVLLNTTKPTLALLDIDLGPTTSLGIAALCHDRGIPVVFTTGYTVRDVPRQCGDAPVLAKPFSPEQLQRALHRAMAVPAVALSAVS